MGILVEDLLTYLHDLKAASFLSDKTKSTGKVYYGNVSTKYSSTHHPSERVALLCKIQLSHRFVVTSWRKHTLDWRSCLSRLLKVAKGSGEETRGAEIVRNFMKDTLGRPCNCNGSCASQEVRLLRLASGPHGLVECSRLLHLKGGHRLFNVCTIMSSLLSKNNNARH
ncbi:hypothetical protein PVAP13_J257520 [Panicum virgatum]|nr:hypothetical protein PVAP13_J257520 [Panicum virgatum]